MPPFLLSKGEIIFRPTWQIESKPVAFILLWAIKYQILLGNMQSSSSILLSVIAHNSRFMLFVSKQGEQGERGICF